jgi:hypothetical protein
MAPEDRLCVAYYTKQVLWIRIGFSADPDSTFYHLADPYPESGIHIRILILILIQGFHQTKRQSFKNFSSLFFIKFL